MIIVPFWVSPTKPEIYDGYTNDPIYDWMKKRNSEGNFIYGEYGDFNILFPTLVRKLSALPNETFKTVENFGRTVFCLIQYH